MLLLLSNLNANNSFYQIQGKISGNFNENSVDVVSLDKKYLYKIKRSYIDMYLKQKKLKITKDMKLVLDLTSNEVLEIKPKK